MPPAWLGRALVEYICSSTLSSNSGRKGCSSGRGNNSSSQGQSSSSQEAEGQAGGGRDTNSCAATPDNYALQQWSGQLCSAAVVWICSLVSGSLFCPSLSHGLCFRLSRWVTLSFSGWLFFLSLKCLFVNRKILFATSCSDRSLYSALMPQQKPYIDMQQQTAAMGVGMLADITRQQHRGVTFLTVL